MNKPIQTGPPTSLELPARLDLGSCNTLVEALSEHRGQDVEIGTGSLEFLGALGAEVLLRAQAEWREAGQKLTLRDPSETFLQGLKELGIPATELTMETST